MTEVKIEVHTQNAFNFTFWLWLFVKGHLPQREVIHGPAHDSRTISYSVYLLDVQ